MTSYRSIFNSTTLFNINIFLLLLASSVKPTESFFEGGLREYTFIPSLLSSNSELWVLIFLSLSSIYIFTYSLDKGGISKINIPIKLYLFLKIWAVFVYAFYDQSIVLLVFSVILMFIIYQYLSLLTFEWSSETTFQSLSKIIAIFSVFFVLLNLYEFLYNQESVVWKGRLYGVTNHPNFIGGYSAILVPFVLSQLKFKKSFTDLFYFLGFIGLLMLVVSSGSRSSLLSLVVALFIWLYFFLGAYKASILLLLMSTVCIPIFVITDVFSFNSNDVNYQRLLSTENTRAEVNSVLWQVYTENSIIGNPTQSEFTSNSYLSAIARLGTIGGILLSSMIIFAFMNLKIKLNRIIKDKQYAAYISSFCAIIPYSAFEGVLMENYSLGQFIFIICLIRIGSKEIIHGR
jgi:hypothetical protein